MHYSKSFFFLLGLCSGYHLSCEWPLHIQFISTLLCFVIVSHVFKINFQFSIQSNAFHHGISLFKHLVGKFLVRIKKTTRNKINNFNNKINKRRGISTAEFLFTICASRFLNECCKENSHHSPIKTVVSILWNYVSASSLFQFW